MGLDRRRRAMGRAANAVARGRDLMGRTPTWVSVESGTSQ